MQNGTATSYYDAILWRLFPPPWPKCLYDDALGTLARSACVNPIHLASHYRIILCGKNAYYGTLHCGSWLLISLGPAFVDPPLDARLISIWTYDPSAGTFILIGHFVVPSDTDRPHPNSFGLPSRLSLDRSLCLSRIELGCQPFFLGSLQNS
ncbi:hypothetical protein FRB91_005520 [Serendipita sp. 411]|nr:hypothetical protein FRB91_005520 [Serendipita sp. 411]